MISIHQSQFLPWLPYFYKIINSDIFVILDDVQFQKNGVQNRNQIKTPRGTQWLTVPVSVSLGMLINEVMLSSADSHKKILKTLYINYRKSTYFDAIYPFIEDVLNRGYRFLHDINRELLMGILKIIDINTEIRYSSDFKAGGKKDDLVIEIIKKSGQDKYLSGKGAFAYMNRDKFKRAGIKLYTYDFTYTEYPQLWDKRCGFITELSIVDLLFNDLKNTRDYILRQGSLYEVNPSKYNESCV